MAPLSSRASCGSSVFCASVVVGLLLLAVPLRAQIVTVSGHISDPSGQAVSGAVVQLYGSSGLLRTTESGADGSFTIANLPNGVYLAECSAEGFQKQSVRAYAQSPTSESAILNFKLALAGLHQEVSVVATDSPQVPLEIAKSISVIGADEIERRDAVSLTDALTNVPGLQLQELGGPGKIASYRFRGLLPEDTAILLDGFRFTDPSDNRGSARPLLSDLLVVGADRVEVLRGAGSTLYGTSAIGGLINVSSSQPTTPAGGYLSFEGGSLGLLQGIGGFGGQSRSGRASYALDFAHINYTHGEDGHDDYRLSSGSSRTTYQLTPRLRLFAKFAMGDSFAFLNQDPTPVPNLPAPPPGQLVLEAVPFPKPGANFYSQLDDPDYTQTNRSYLGALKLDYQTTSHWSQTFGYQSLRSLRHYFDGPAETPLETSLGVFPSGPQQYNGGLDELFWRNTFEIGRFDSLAVHLNWERTTFDQTAFGLNIRAAQRAFSPQLQNQISLLNGRIQVVLAGQAQYYRLDTPHFSDATADPYTGVSNIDVPSSYNGDVAVAYRIDRSNTKLRAHAGNGFRSPSLYERFGAAGFGSYFGNPLLKPERTVFADGGVDQYLLANKLQLSATYFYTHYQTTVLFTSTPNDPFGRRSGYLNGSGGNARGVELSASVRPSSVLSVSGSYTYTNSDQAAATPGGTTLVLGVPDHQFTLDAALRPLSRLSLDWRIYAVSSHDFQLFQNLLPFGSPVYRFPGYALVGVTGSYILRQTERTRLRFLTRVDNLLNREYFNAGFLEPKATARAGFRFDF